MTPTQTRTKPSVLDGLKERQQKWDKAQADASALGTEHGTKVKAAQALADERRRLVHRNPVLVDHLGAPVGPDNPVGEIDKKLAELGDLQDLWAQVQHARKIAESARQSRDDFVVSHYSELLEAKRPEAEAVANSANQAAKPLVEELKRYLEFHGEIASYTVPVQGITTHVVPGLEAAVGFLKVVEGIDLQPPIPEEGS
jgi:hypothetical protein